MSFKTNNIKHETQNTSLSKRVPLYTSKVYQKVWTTFRSELPTSKQGHSVFEARPPRSSDLCPVEWGGGNLKPLVYPASIENEKTLQQNHSFPDIYLHKPFSVWMWRAHYCILPNILGTPCILRLRSQTGSSNFKANNIYCHIANTAQDLTCCCVCVRETERARERDKERDTERERIPTTETSIFFSSTRY
jgi:hypothetical protein